MDKVNWISIIVAGLGAGLTYLFGGWDVAIIVLVVFVVLDYITGVLGAVMHKNLSSDVGWKGIAKKALIFVILIVAVLLDRLMDNDAWIFRTLVCYFYIANEGISLTENAVGMGVPVPDKLMQVLAQIKKKDIQQEDK